MKAQTKSLATKGKLSKIDKNFANIELKISEISTNYINM